MALSCIVYHSFLLLSLQIIILTSLLNILLILLIIYQSCYLHRLQVRLHSPDHLCLKREQIQYVDYERNSWKTITNVNHLMIKEPCGRSPSTTKGEDDKNYFQIMLTMKDKDWML